MNKRPLKIVLIPFLIIFILITIPLLFIYRTIEVIMTTLIFTLIVSTFFSLIINYYTSKSLIVIKTLNDTTIKKIESFGYHLTLKSEKYYVFNNISWKKSFSGEVIIEKINNKYYLIGSKWLIKKLRNIIE